MAEPTQTRGGTAPLVDELDELASLQPRRAGSEAERRAARRLEARLREAGRSVSVEPTRIRPAFALTHLITAVAGIVGSVLSVYAPVAGLIVMLVTTLSALGELTGAYPALRLLMPARASQNVHSEEDGGKRGVIVLVAHYDAPRTALIFTPRLARWPRVMLGSLGLITLCALGRLIGIDGTWFTAIQFVPTVVLIVLAPLFADAALAATSGGAADNAAGAAVVLRLAQSYANRLQHFDLVAVFTGGSAHFAFGMREWLRRHRRELDAEATAVIAVDNLGAGEPVCARREGAALSARMHPTLLELAGEVGIERYDGREVSDAYLARGAGLPAVRISSEQTGPDVAPDPETLARAYELVSRLLERIDADIGPRLG